MLNVAYSLHNNLAEISFYNFSMPVILIPLKLMSSSLVLMILVTSNLHASFPILDSNMSIPDKC